MDSPIVHGLWGLIKTRVSSSPLPKRDDLPRKCPKGCTNIACFKLQSHDQQLVHVPTGICRIYYRIKEQKQINHDEPIPLVKKPRIAPDMSQIRLVVNQEALANCAEVVVKTTALCFSMPKKTVTWRHMIAFANIAVHRECGSDNNDMNHCL